MPRAMASETEYGILVPGERYPNVIAASTKVIEAMADVDGTMVGWDYYGEDPLNDMRGHRYQRASVDPSLLTDNPDRLAPSGVRELGEAELNSLRAPKPRAFVTHNGGRIYVDHAHPEYSAPECASVADMVRFDRAGELLARKAIDRLESEIVLFKNNTDGKGASYGAHENYSVTRSLPFSQLSAALIPFMVVRPLICGSGKVGLGQRSERPGFQISQRADFVENDIGLETTFNRPIVNTRDEPHADAKKWRRLHVIGGDANLFECSAYLRFGATHAFLWLLENAYPVSELEALAIAKDPVEETWAVSHDLEFKHRIATRGAGELSALDLHQRYIDLILAALRRAESGDFGEQSREDLSELQHIVEIWAETVSGLAKDPLSMAGRVEWVGKYRLLEGMRMRHSSGWDDPLLAAMDLQWADLRPEKSLVAKLRSAGQVQRLFTESETAAALNTPPAGTRALIRARAVRKYPQRLISASWGTLVFENGNGRLVRANIGDPLTTAAGGTDSEPLSTRLPDIDQWLKELTKEGNEQRN